MVLSIRELKICILYVKVTLFYSLELYVKSKKCFYTYTYTHKIKDTVMENMLLFLEFEIFDYNKYHWVYMAYSL